MVMVRALEKERGSASQQHKNKVVTMSISGLSSTTICTFSMAAAG
jgi:hypothetical protein